MIGKVMTGKNFGGCLRYVLQKPEATLLDACGIRTESIQSIIDDFNTQRKLNPILGVAVGHIALSWSAKDKEKLTPELMVERGKEYLDKMKIHNTQYLIVQHQNRDHAHIHIVYNRVDNEGKTISDQFQKQRNAKICKEITLKYGYYMASGKENVKRQRLKGADLVKYELNDAIRAALKYAKGWSSLEKMLSSQGIAVLYKYKGGSNDIQGVRFSKNGMIFKGSQLDRSLSYGRIDQQITFNQQKDFSQNMEDPQNTIPGSEMLEEINPPQTPQNDYVRIQNIFTGVMDELLRSVHINHDQNDDLLRKKRRKF